VTDLHRPRLRRARERQRYTGGNIVATFGHPAARRVHALQLEVNASLLMTTSREDFIAHVTRGGIPDKAHETSPACAAAC
jgi:N-formylglutamate amidohydrolase